MIQLVDLDAPIVSASGLGGFCVGARIARYRRLLSAAATQYDRIEAKWAEVWTAPWSVKYSVGEVYDLTYDELVEMVEGIKRGDLSIGDSPVTELVPAVEIYVDVRIARIYMLRATSAYRGTFGDIAVGMTVREAHALEPRIRYDHPMDELVLDDDVGIGFALPAYDPLPEEVPDLAIEGIEVYEPRLTTRGGITF